MGAFFSTILGIWLVVAVFSAPYFWFKYTNRSQAPIARRIIALSMGLTWPYQVVKFFRTRQQAREAATDHAAAEERILGGGVQLNAPRPATSPIASSNPRPHSSIANPFDN